LILFKKFLEEYFKNKLIKIKRIERIDTIIKNKNNSSTKKNLKINKIKNKSEISEYYTNNENDKSKN